MNFTFASERKTMPTVIDLKARVVRKAMPTGHPLLAVARAQERMIRAAATTLTAALKEGRAEAKDRLRDLSLLLQIPSGVLLSRIIEVAKEKDKATLREIFY